MEEKAKILFLCLLVVLLSDFSTGFFRVRPPRRCFRTFARRRRCFKPYIPMLSTTQKPKTLQPTTEATTPPVVFLNPVKSHSSELPYCKSRDVNEILRPAGSRTKRAVSWPYECRHASILHFSGDYQFIWPIYDCCSKCSFPEFTLCVAKSRSKNSPEWMCPSEGLQCIVGCVNKHKPGGTIGILPNVVKPGIKPGSGGILPNVVKPGIKPAPGKPVLSNCEKLETENGKQCIRKLCVPLGQAFKP
ncbi:Hypothetical predicted protein [Paramuricea clavata]|uniref:Uncharacterized protein n=1 Tax=Paramuricea clavata TaxID=317549 RepID=A0A6S7GBB6_PARCT|nr:Hypothetical predicted protein [Paramuricea clavata]